MGNYPAVSGCSDAGIFKTLCVNMDQVIIIDLFHISVYVVGKAAHVQPFDKTGGLDDQNRDKISCGQS